MSNNPFHDLANYLEELNAGNETLSERLVALANSGETIRDVHLRILNAYQHCYSLLKTQGKERLLDVVLAPVWDFLVNPDTLWTSHAPDTLAPLAIESVRLLGNDHEITSVLPTALTTEELDTLRMTFEKIQEVIQSHESIPQELATHIVYLCNRGIDLIKGERIDLVTLRSICFETITVTNAACVTLPENTQRTVRGFIKTIWERWGYPIAVNVASNLISTSVLSEITKP